jgi:hypothetical protein
MTDTALTPGRVWKLMTPEQRQRATRVFWRDETEAADRQEAERLIAQHKKIRPKTVAGLDDEQRARQLASMPLPDAVAGRVLMLYHLAEQRPMMGAFLDALAIPHDNGLIQADTVAPDAARVGAAATAIAKAYPAADVSIYLNTLVCQDPETWAAVRGLPETQT